MNDFDTEINVLDFLNYFKLLNNSFYSLSFFFLNDDITSLRKNIDEFNTC